MLVVVHTKNVLTGAVTELGRAHIDMVAMQQRRQSASAETRSGGGASGVRVGENEVDGGGCRSWVKIRRKKSGRVVGKIFLRFIVQQL